MIIIKTSNGDAFVNEKTTQIVRHDRQNKTAVIRNPNEGLDCNIQNVEGIIYANDAQPMSWQDEGSALEKARKDNEEKRESQPPQGTLRFSDFRTRIKRIINIKEL